MRNIICISAILACTATFAQELPTTGCFERIYDANHLHEYPDQEVAELRIFFGHFSDYFEINETLENPVDYPVAWVEALTASTPSTTAGGTAGRHFERVLFCGVHPSRQNDPDINDDARVRCSGECDGGMFQVLSIDAHEMSVRMHRVYLSRLTECGSLDGSVILGTWTEPTTYKLFSVPDENCARDQN